jgi:signal transduction histidine kinase
MSFRSLNKATLFGVLVVLPTLAGLAYLLVNRTEPVPLAVVPWTLLIAAVELLQVPTWRGVQVSVGYPMVIAVAFLYPPEVAALVALLSASDPRELRREVSLLRALFNRCQVTLAVLAASTAFHAFATVEDDFFQLLAAALLAIVVDYAITLSLVTIGVALLYRVRPLTVAAELLGRGQEFLVSYLGLGLLGTALAKLFAGVGAWSIVIVIAPLLFARQMFMRTQSLEEAHKELQEREQVLRSLSNAMAEERADERQKIAAYLHDDLAQVLFRLSLQVDVARKLLDRGDIPQTAEQLEKIKESKQDTSDRVRALIRQLHRSPLGAKGLAEALVSFTDDVGRDSGVTFHHHVEDVEMPGPIALLIYKIAGEGVMNALKHARATDIWITVSEQGDDLVLELRDNGRGFDTSAPGPEGHFGMAMMRERAQVGGGRFEVQSSPDEGATITVAFPTSLLQQDPQPSTNGADLAADTPGVHASPGTSASTEPVADGSRGTVHV